MGEKISKEEREQYKRAVMTRMARGKEIKNVKEMRNQDTGIDKKRR